MPVERSGANGSRDKVSPYLRDEPPILRDACRKLGRDDGGRHCPVCCVRQFCEDQARRAGRLEAAAVRGKRPLRCGRDNA